jgi:hypothetical protein
MGHAPPLKLAASVESPDEEDERPDAHSTSVFKLFYYAEQTNVASDSSPR